tara:strand:+ start:1690 stop:2361 length:672 start_codon:yes stop_codon:yes gene_type:complete
MTVVVFDLESDSSFRAFAGAARDLRFKRMQCTVACALVLDSELCRGPDPAAALANGEHRHWWRDVSEKGQDPFEGLLRLFDEADVIVGYNAGDFDFPLLEKHYGGKAVRYLSHRMKLLDPFEKLKAATGVWIKLDDLLLANAIPQKTGSGLEAIKMWEEGKRDQLLAYCTYDVLALARLCLLRKLRVPSMGVAAPGQLFGIAAALAAAREGEAEKDAEGFVIV